MKNEFQDEEFSEVLVVACHPEQIDGQLRIDMNIMIVTVYSADTLVAAYVIQGYWTQQLVKAKT